MRRINHKWTLEEIRRIKQFMECNTAVKLAKEMNVPYNSLIEKIKILRNKENTSC